MCDESHDIGRDCAVCLQKCHHPAQLPCGHIFCFLCVKGVAIQNKNCAMCRATIPSDYLDNPMLLETSDTQANIGHDEFQWYYEGRNGWWKYDERSNHTLELEYNSGSTSCNLLLAGAVYKIDFETMLQTRRSDQSRRRRVRRETPAFPAKGIAGIKIITEIETKLENEEERQTVDNSACIDVANTETRSSEIQENSNQEEPNNALETVIQSIRSINLDNPQEANSDVNETQEDS